MSEAALAGVKVLEYCEMVSGPYCAKLLADLGAEVVKIEKPQIGDEARRIGPFLNKVNHPERSGLFLYLNTSKLGITLNLETTTGKKLFNELVKDVDILVEDTTPGTVERLGLGYETLKGINPSLIMTSVTPYGQTGPYREYKARHLNIYHISGQAYFSYNVERLPGQPPVQGGGYVGDYDAGLSAAVATLAALYRRGFNSIGQHIDVSREEALISLDRVDIGAFANEGADTSKRRRRGMLGGMMPCKDGYVVIAAALQQQWEGLVKLMGSPEWATGGKCKDEFARYDNAAELQPLIEKWMLQHTKEEIYHGGQKFGCPTGPVNSAAEVFDSPQIEARGFFVDIDHPEAGTLSYPSASYKFSETPWQASRAAPLLGEHNREVYCQRLGYTEKQLAKMKASGVI
jgi:crotonobetainyl-CoA:carnitine CoA-transferase CaiB-like acyl-CoA transferase